MNDDEDPTFFKYRDAAAFLIIYEDNGDDTLLFGHVVPIDNLLLPSADDSLDSGPETFALRTLQ